MNFGFLGKGNAAHRGPARRTDPRRSLRTEAPRGLGHHSGRHRRLPARWPTIFDVQVAIHTDTINEAGFVEDTIAAIAGRAIHTYHTEGAGGGHAPDIIRIAALPQCFALVHQSHAALTP